MLYVEKMEQDFINKRNAVGRRRRKLQTSINTVLVLLVFSGRATLEQIFSSWNQFDVMSYLDILCLFFFFFF